MRLRRDEVVRVRGRRRDVERDREALGADLGAEELLDRERDAEAFHRGIHRERGVAEMRPARRVDVGDADRLQPVRPRWAHAFGDDGVVVEQRVVAQVPRFAQRVLAAQQPRAAHRHVLRREDRLDLRARVLAGSEAHHRDRRIVAHVAGGRTRFGALVAIDHVLRAGHVKLETGMRAGEAR